VNFDSTKIRFTTQPRQDAQISSNVNFFGQGTFNESIKASLRGP